MRYKLNNQIFVQFNDHSGNIFFLARHFNLGITDNLSDFITVNLSEMKNWIKLFSFLILTILRCLSKDLIADMIGSKFSLTIGKDLAFDMYKLGSTLKKSWLNVSQSSSSPGIVLPSSTRFILSPFDEFLVNNGWTVLEKLLLSVIFLVSRFSK